MKGVAPSVVLEALEGVRELCRDDEGLHGRLEGGGVEDEFAVHGVLERFNDLHRVGSLAVSPDLGVELALGVDELLGMVPSLVDDPLHFLLLLLLLLLLLRRREQGRVSTFE